MTDDEIRNAFCCWIPSEAEEDRAADALKELAEHDMARMQRIVRSLGSEAIQRMVAAQKRGTLRDLAKFAK